MKNIPTIHIAEEKISQSKETRTKRLLQSGFFAGLRYSNIIYTSYKDLEKNERKEIIKVLGDLFEDYGMSREPV